MHIFPFALPAKMPGRPTLLRLVIRFTFTILQVAVQKPANYEPDGQQGENEQRARHLDRPEEKLDLNGGNVLKDEEKGKTDKDQNENQFVVHWGYSPCLFPRE